DLREHSIVRDFEIRQRDGARNRANLVRNITTGVNGDDAGRFQGFARIDAIYARVRVHRTNERHVQSVGQPDVVDVVCETLDQSRVFGALYSLSDVLAHDASRERSL